MPDFLRGRWVGTREKIERGVDREPWPVLSSPGCDVDAVEGDSVMAGRRCSGVVVPHPLNELTVLEVLTEPASQASPCCRFGVAFAALDKRTRADRFRESGFQRDGCESHPLDQKA